MTMQVNKSLLKTYKAILEAADNDPAFHSVLHGVVDKDRLEREIRDAERVLKGGFPLNVRLTFRNAIRHRISVRSGECVKYGPVLSAAASDYGLLWEGDQAAYLVPRLGRMVLLTTFGFQWLLPDYARNWTPTPETAEEQQIQSASAIAGEGRKRALAAKRKRKTRLRVV